MATSTIPAVKAAVVAGLQALTGVGGPLENVEVTWSVKGPPGRDWIMVGNVTGRQASAAIGQQSRDEVYTLEVLVSVVRPTRDDARQTAETAFAHAARIEGLVRPLSQPPLGVPGVIWVLVEKTDLEEFVDADQREARVIVHLGVKARI